MLTHDFQSCSNSVPDLSLARDSAAPSHGFQRASPSFLELPAEIRNMVYTWLFPTGRSAVQLLARYQGGYIDMGGCLGLLTTCRQIYDEVSSLLRSDRRFEVVQPKTFVDMFKDYRMPPLRFILWVRDYICPDHVLEIRYDIDKRTKEKTGPPLYDICQKLRDGCIWRCFYFMKVTVSISYPFKGLEEWGQSVSGYLNAIRSCNKKIVFILRLPQADSDGKTNIYLPAVRLFRGTMGIYPYPEFKVVGVDGDEDEANVRPLTDLASIGKKLLIFVYHLLGLSSDPLHQPIPRIWIDKDLQVSHAEIEDEYGRSVHVLSNLGDYTSDEVYEKAFHLVLFFTGNYEYTGVEDAAAPKLAGFAADTIYAEDTLITFAQKLAKSCVHAYFG